MCIEIENISYHYLPSVKVFIHITFIENGPFVSGWKKDKETLIFISIDYIYLILYLD